ncbi:reverse transcriptase domain-containing protein [Tanacetum coccineum]
MENDEVEPLTTTSLDATNAKGKVTQNVEFYQHPFVFKEPNRDIRNLVASPFTNRIRDYDMPDGLKVPTNLKTYDGMSYPDDHLTVFMRIMDVHKLTEPRLKTGRLFKDLIARPPTSLEDLFTQTHNFIKAEDANNENRLREPRQENRETKQHATYKDLPRRPKDKFVSRAAMRKTIMVKFMIIMATLPYNVILGRPTMRQLGVIASTLHSIMKFPTQDRIAVIRGETPNLICNRISRKRDRTNEEEQIPEEENNEEKVVINEAYSEQKVMIEKNLPRKLKQQLFELLRSNIDIFAWTPADMTGIPRKLAEHRLNIHPRTFPVWKKKRVLAKERSDVITQEAIELGEHEIIYKPRFAVKGQILVDFLAESPRTKERVETEVMNDGPEEAEYVLKEAHFGSCGAHAGARTIAQKAARLGHYWPTMYNDASKLVETCVWCNKANLCLNLELLEERREMAALRTAKYKAQTKRYYNRKVKHKALKVGDFVLWKNEASKKEGQKKLDPNWEGPYQVISAKQTWTYTLADMKGLPIP